MALALITSFAFCSPVALSVHRSAFTRPWTDTTSPLRKESTNSCASSFQSSTVNQSGSLPSSLRRSGRSTAMLALATQLPPSKYLASGSLPRRPMNVCTSARSTVAINSNASIVMVGWLGLSRGKAVAVRCFKGLDLIEPVEGAPTDAMERWALPGVAPIRQGLITEPPTVGELF